MPDGQKRKIKKMKRQPGAPEVQEPPASPPAQKAPETAIPVAVEEEGEASGEGSGEVALPGEGEPATEPSVDGGAMGPERGDEGEPSQEPALVGPGVKGADLAGGLGEQTAPPDGAAGETAGGEGKAERARASEEAGPGLGEAVEQGGTAPGPGYPGHEAPAEERWTAEPVEPEAPEGPSDDATGARAEAGTGEPDISSAAFQLPSPEAEEAPPRQAVMADDELLRLKAELSRRLVTLETEKERLEELGNQLVLRGEELEQRHLALEEREAAGRRLDEDLSKKSELIHASSEALGALADEVRARHKTVLATEEEVRSVREEIERLRTDLSERERRFASELSALDENRRKVDQMLADLGARDAALKEGENEHGQRSEELVRARREVEELETRLKTHETRLRKKEDEVRALEQHLLSIEDEIRLCPHCGVVDEFQQLARRGQELRSRGEDLEELDLEIKQAHNALREGFYDTATDHARRAADLLVKKERENARRDVVIKVMAAEGLIQILREARADTSVLQAAVDEAWQSFRTDDLKRAETLAEKARREAGALEQERFQALDALVSCNTQIATLKKSGVNVLPAEKKREEAERSMASGDFRRARQLAAEAVAMVSDAAQSQDVSTAMSQIKLAEETIEDLRSLGLDASEWERTLNRSREFLKKLDFKSAEETARWVRQKSKEAGRLYRHALLTIDHCNSVISTYKDMGLVVRKAEELQDEAKGKLRGGDPELATNLARKAERMVKEISERQKGAQAALKKATAAIRADRKAGKDATRIEKLFDLAQHQLELGEYANAMKLANKAVEALSSSGPTALELCPTCGEAIPEGSPDCPNCAERARLRAPVEKPAEPAGQDLAQKTRLGAKGGRKYACPYCGELFEITVDRRPITITCPWCSYEVSVVE
ncbi:MAG: hypothetical protein FJ149_02940 [Euryarchaeota archaeon]|nr:hypothetical protein [Euryarchaeota archaeon]